MHDIHDEINRRIWTVEGLVSQARLIAEQSQALSPTRKKEISVEISDWSEDRVKRHIQAVKEAVENPIRHENKSRLESLGIDTENLPDNVLDRTQLINRLVSLIESIRGIDDRLADILIRKHAIRDWLIGAPDEIESKLQGVVEVGPSLTAIMERKIDSAFMDEILRTVLLDVDLLDEAGQLVSDLEYVAGFGVSADLDVEYERFCKALSITATHLREIVEDCGMARDDIDLQLRGKTVSQAEGIAEKILHQCVQERTQLLEEWATYAAALQALEEHVADPPQRIPELRRAVRDVRKRCLKRLGAAGLGLLRFIAGEGDFPESIDIGELRRTLEVLRPMLSRSLREEG